MGMNNSLDWPPIEAELMKYPHKLKSAETASQVNKMIRNIGVMVSDLSKLELEYRRSPYKSDTLVKEQLGRVNEAIKDLENWIPTLFLKFN